MGNAPADHVINIPIIPEADPTGAYRKILVDYLSDLLETDIQYNGCAILGLFPELEAPQYNVIMSNTIISNNFVTYCG
jgi:hypothetical protein